MINKQVIEKADRVKNILESYLKKWEIPIVSCGSNITPLCKAICGSFFMNTCQRQRDGTYQLCRRRADSLPPMVLHPLSICNPKPPLFLVFGQATAMANVTSTKYTFLSQVTPIDPL